MEPSYSACHSLTASFSPALNSIIRPTDLDYNTSKLFRTEKLKHGAVRGTEMNHAQVTASKWAFIW